MADISTGRQRGIVPFVDETTGRLPDQYLPQGVIDLQGDLEQAVSDASQSATAAKASATEAASSASNASQSASSASTSASQAGESASQANGFASTASRAATTATGAASNASESATAAQQSASAASESAQAAETSKTNAAASASAAKASETNAASSATAAQQSASQAQSSATDASQNASIALEKVSVLEQDINSFKATVPETYTTKNEFNALEIGGTNLIKGSKPYGKSGFFESFNSVTDNEYGEVTLQSTTTSQSYPKVRLDYSDTFTFDKTDIVAGDKYVISYDVMMLERTYTASSTFTESWIGIHHNGGNWSGLIKYDGIKDDFLSAPLNKWAHFEHSITANAWDGTTAVEAAIQLGTKSVGKFRFRMRNVKLEKGTKATAWSPAPDDFFNKLSNDLSNYVPLSTYQALEARVQALEAKLPNQ